MTIKAIGAAIGAIGALAYRTYTTTKHSIPAEKPELSSHKVTSVEKRVFPERRIGSGLLDNPDEDFPIDDGEWDYQKTALTKKGLSPEKTLCLREMEGLSPQGKKNYKEWLEQKTLLDNILKGIKKDQANKK